MIIKLKDNKYVQWSKSSDSPSYVMTFEEACELIRQDFSVRALQLGQDPNSEAVNTKVQGLIEILKTTGYSSPNPGVTIADIEKYNRAGPDESHLSIDEIIKQYSV